MKYLVLLVLASVIQPTVTFADEANCLKTGKGCAELDIDSPRVEQAYQAGCKAKDWYACARLGQFYQVKKSKWQQAYSFYDTACKNGDALGCSGAYESAMELCYGKSQKKYCGKQEPKGNYRVLAFLQGFSAKYADAFEKHNFEAPWSVKKAEFLYKKLVAQKNKKLLAALEKELTSGRHDGADGESLRIDVECMKGQCASDAGEG